MKKIIFAVLVVAYADVWATKLEIRSGYNKEASEALLKAASNDDAEEINQAIAKGADVNAKDKNGFTALHRAVMYNATKAIKALVAAGVDLNVKDRNDFTALHRAVNENFKESIKILIAAKADVNVQDKIGRTALILAAKKNLQEVMKGLIAAGANVNAKANNGRTALYWAMLEHSREAIKILIEAEAVIPDELFPFQIEKLDSVIEKINEERERYNHALRGLSALEGKSGKMNLLIFERLYAPQLQLASEVYAQRQAAEAI